MKYLKKFESFNDEYNDEYSDELKYDKYGEETSDYEYNDEYNDEYSDYEENDDCVPCKDDTRNVRESKKSKPDFLDLDKDGNKKESMKKAAADKKKKEGKTEKPTKLTAAQKRLPKGLRDAIAKGLRD